MRTVVIPAAGKGTRLLPLTRVTAKELLPVYDQVVIDFAMEEAIGAGASRIVVVISEAKTAIRDYLRDYVGPAPVQPSKPTAVGPWTTADRRPEVVFVFQDKPLGLGDAILRCKNHVLPGPFGVILPDDVILGDNCLAEMRSAYASGQMVAAMEVTAKETSQYGIFNVRGSSMGKCIPVAGMVEKPAAGSAPSNLAAVGRYILDPMIFEILPHTPLGAGGELQLTDAIAIASNAVPLTAFRFSGSRYDCGNHAGLLSASLARQRSLGRATESAWAAARQGAGASVAALRRVAGSSPMGESAR